MARQGLLVTLLVAMLAIATGGLAACGEDKPARKTLLSSTKAAELRSTLDGVERKVDAGDCAGARDATLALQQQVDALSTSVNASLRTALGSGVSRLQTLVDHRCEPQGTTTTTTTPTETVPEGPTLPAGETEKKQKKEPKGKAKGHEKKQQGTDENVPPTVPQEQTGGSGE
jgi:hypothetical protein